MVIISIVLLPLKDSSGSEVNGQHKQDYSNSHAHIQYPSNTQTTPKGKIIYSLFSILGFLANIIVCVLLNQDANIIT